MYAPVPMLRMVTEYRQVDVIRFLVNRFPALRADCEALKLPFTVFILRLERCLQLYGQSKHALCMILFHTK